MKTTEYDMGDKVYAVIGLKVITAIITGISFKASINNISDKIDDSNVSADYFVSAINENGTVDTYPYSVSSVDLFTDITKAAAVVGNKAMKV